MPTQEEEKASVEPAAKARPILKPSSTSNWNFIPMEQRKWIDIEEKRCKDPYCFQMSKIITQLLRHKEVGREEDAGVPYDRVVEKCKEVLSEDSRYWSDEIKEKLSMALYWSAKKWIDVLSQGGGQRKRFQYSLKPNCPGKHQSCIARQCIVTKGFYQVRLSRRKRKGIEINSAWQTCRILYCCEPDKMDDEQGLRETFWDLSKARIAPCKYTWK